MRQRRITADIDTKNIFKILFYVARALRLNSQEVTIKRSSNKGFHLICWCRLKGSRNKLRAYLGDDVRRIKLDKMHKFGKQTLFKIKRRLR